MKDNLPKFVGIITITKRHVKTGKILSIHKYKNLFCNAGRLSILQRMAGDTTKGGITYLALGDDVTPPDVTNISLGNELYRHIITTKSAAVLTLSTSTFIPSTEGNNTYKELGLFGDAATGAADSGTMFTHLAIDEEKSFGESLTVDYDIVVS